MESEGSYLFSSTVIVGIFVGAIALLLTYILKLFNNEQKVEEQQKNEKIPQHSEKKKETANKAKKKVPEAKWSSKADKQGFSHPWFIKSLKGHTGEVLDVDFSSNNKYLISCGDEDPGGSTESSTSSLESAKESSRPPSAEPSPKAKGLSRRQRKNRRKEDVSPESKRLAKKKLATKNTIKKHIASTPLKMWTKLKMDEAQLYSLLKHYVLKPHVMYSMGYPVFTDKKNGLVLIYKTSHKPRVDNVKFDVNAKEFVPKKIHGDDYDSGQGSGNSSDSGENDYEPSDRVAPRPIMPTFQWPYAPFAANIPSRSVPGKTETTHLAFVDSNSGGSRLIYLTAIYIPNIVPERKSSVDHPQRVHACVRCYSTFITKNSEYVSQSACNYHWGKLLKSYLGLSVFSCCQSPAGAPGCTQAKYHVWNGLEDGPNHFSGYISTKHRKSVPVDGNFGIYALDCEMSYTVAGLEVTKVTVVGVDGRIVYESYVKPDNEILDFNTRYSGITQKDMVGAKTLKEVQNDLMGFINQDTILIGHGLENDLRALKIVHNRVIDTAHSFPHHLGLPYRRSLKQLAWYVLKRDIQTGQHCSYEDAVASLELILSLVKRNAYT